MSIQVEWASGHDRFPRLHWVLDEKAFNYCQDDGSGLIWGITVGFDPKEFSTNSELIALDGKAIDLAVTVTDDDGKSCTGEQTVFVQVGR